MEPAIWALGKPGRKRHCRFDGEHTGKPRLKYYFDISDTHEARFPRPVPIWTCGGIRAGHR